MTKLKELTAAYIAALDAYDTALKAECDCDAATDAAACAAATDATDFAYRIYVAARAARDAYFAEPKKTQEENSNDQT
jgi:hypothetical protein